MRLRVNVSVTSDDQQIIARTVEALSRILPGLAMDGAEPFLMISPDVDDDD